MPTLDALVARFVEDERGATNILAPESVTAQAVAAVSFFAGFAVLSDTEQPIGETLNLTDSEWGWIRPLFALYVQREQALQLEATRGLGADVFGRSSSEIATDIERQEAELPRRAFLQPVFTV
ncbi:MAG: hypothetical protein K9L88_11330 [Chromatiaceae bacterium]|nr:hypothetical protein [Chromatiaceae bacterium]